MPNSADRTALAGLPNAVELAERAGVTRATVNRLENRRPASIDLMVLEKLAGALGVEPGLLIVREWKGGRG